MAYNNGFPVGYPNQSQIFYPQYQPQVQQMMQPTQMSIANQNYQQMSQNQAQPQQIQNGGFISVRSEDEARNYPVAPGNSVTFKLENAPYVCEKTQSFSQFESPIFVKYRLVKEEDASQITTQDTESQKITSDYALKADLTAIWKEIALLKETIEKLKQEKEKPITTVKKTATKKESGANE